METLRLEFPKTLRDYNSSRTLSTEIVDGKTFRNMRRKRKKQ